MATRRIEIDFAVPVELSSSDCGDLADIAQRIAKANVPEGHVHWCFGQGSKPIWSKADAVFLGKTPDANAPDQGEPGFDDDVFYIETACRKAYPKEQEGDANDAH